MKKLFFISAFVLAAFATRGAAPSGYYDSCENKNQAELLSALCKVVGPHTTISNKGLLDLYKKSDVYPDGKLWDMYSTKHWNSGESCGQYKGVGDCYNREHSFPKSWFDDASPMYSDAFHLYPTDGKVNGQRCNYPYGECANGTTLPSSGSVKALGKLGKSTFAGYSGTVFEPDDQYKGDFARSYFYMAAAYNTRISQWSSDMLAGNSYPAYKTWAINLLLKWHRQDPVSQKERDRQEVVYGRQNNRNPFIDHPELAEYIWGDKKNEKWHANGAPDPVINQPVNASTFDLGVTGVNHPITKTLTVKGSNLKSGVTLSVNSSYFTLSSTSISASAATSGATVTVSFNSSVAQDASATLAVTSGSAKSLVTLKARAVDGIPALAATNVTETSFTANWIYLGDESVYKLDVRDADGSIDGYPLDVDAAKGNASVTNLSPSTDYTYVVSNSSLKSNVVEVTTTYPIPSIELLEDSFDFAVDPMTASEAKEVWMIADNIESSITVSVSAPFEVSTDLSGWSRSLTLQPADDHFYLRVGPAQVGEYRSSIVVKADGYLNDDVEATASVRDTSTPWFVEDFELEGDYDTYNDQTYVGRIAVWNLTNAGIWKGDGKVSGTYSLRLGSKSDSSMTTAEPKKDGIATISFHGCRWSAKDGDATIAVEYSADGASWTPAASVVLDSDSFKEYKATVNKAGAYFIRLRQTAGKRANIDDVTVTDYRQSSVTEIETDADWTARNDNGSLTIDNHADRRLFTVYDIDGAAVKSLVVDHAASINVAAGVYIVVSDDQAQRVIVY